MTPFERYLTNWKSPEFAARYPDSFRYEREALGTAANLRPGASGVATVDLTPGDMTRYHFTITTLAPVWEFCDRVEYGLALWNHGRHGATMILPRDAFGGLAPTYIEDKLGVDPVTAAVIGGFLVQVGSHMGVEQT